MSGFILCGDGDSGHTLVPNLFLDNYMPEANGEYVKIYLYLLRCLRSDSQELSLALIADKFEHTENDVRRALKYWEKMKLLKLEYDSADNLTGIRMVGDSPQTSAPAPTPAPAPVKAASQPAPAAKDPAPAASGKPSPVELLPPAEAQQLLFICEQYLGKTLSSQEVSKILDFHDVFGFSADLIEYLVEYCVSKGHRSIHYIESVALAWHRDGFTTVSQAKQQTNTYSKAYFSILKAFGISNRNPVDVEITYMNKWLRDYGFSVELITEACSRTMAAIHQPSFEYADKILSTWQKHQVTSLSDLAALDQNRQNSRQKSEPAKQNRTSPNNRFHNFQERDYDFRKLEEQLINQ